MRTCDVTPRQWSRIVLCFPAALFFTVHAAFAGTTITRDELDARFGASSPGGVIQLEEGETVDFANNNDAISVDKAGLAIKGWTSPGFAGRIGALSGRIGDMGTGVTESYFKDVVGEFDGWEKTVGGGLSGIRGTATPTSSRSQTGSGGFDRGKWLTTPSSSVTAASLGNGLALSDLRFGNVEVLYKSGRFVNGLIGNDNLANCDTSMGDIAGNVFTDIGVTLTSSVDTNYLAGGGVIGVRSTGEETPLTGLLGSGNAEMGFVSGNIFDDIRITTTNAAGASSFDISAPSAYLEGGGLVGVNGASSPADVRGHAFLRGLSDNYFTNIKILSNDILLGGGLVGVNNNSKNESHPTGGVYAMIGDLSDPSDFTNPASGGVLRNIFGNGEVGDISVGTGYSIRGGGVIGLNGLSNAAVDLVDLADNAFAGISVNAGSYIKGGGIVGLQTNDGGHGNSTGDDGHNLGTGFEMAAAPATLRAAAGNLFLNQTVTAGDYIQGGGVIGLRSNLGTAELRSLTDNIFKGVNVATGTSGEPNTTGELSGGGVVGISAADQALMGTVINNSFDSVTVSTKDLNGGGIIGAHGRDDQDGVTPWVTIDEIDDNVFTNADVAAENISGGGIVGVHAEGGLSALGNVTNNTFGGSAAGSGLTVATTGNLVGGGVLGVWNDDVDAWSAIDRVNDNFFTGINVTVGGGYLQGGGVVGIRGNNQARIGEIVRSVFKDNAITVSGGYIDGGGIIGVTGHDGNNQARIEAIAGSTFAGNAITVSGGYIDGGGIIGVTSHDGGNPTAGIVRIDDSVFERNVVSANKDVLGGIVYSYGLNGGMTIRNSSFLDNTLTSADGTVYGTVTVDTGSEFPDGDTLTLTASSGNAAIFRGNVISDKNDSSRTNSLYFGTIAEPDDGDPDPAEWSPTLTVSPEAGGVVALYDPIWVNQDDPGSPNETAAFTMNVQDKGDFIWGGANVFTLDDDASGTVTLESGSVTTILDGGSTTTFVNGQYIDDKPGYNMSLDAGRFMFNVERDARLNVEGHNTFDLSGNAGSAPVANLNGTLHFNLHNTEVYRQGEIPADHAGNDYKPLLTINVPASGQERVDLSNSTISLSDFKGGTRTLVPGDRFYLIEVDNGIEGDPANAAFAGDPLNDAETVRHGNLTTYTFIIDKNGENYVDNDPAQAREVDTRFLVARLRSVEPGAGAPPVATARVPGITLLQRSSDWLMEIPFYEFGPLCDPCDPCDPCNPCNDRNPRSGAGAGTSTDWVWSSFAEAKGTWYRAGAGSHAHADVRGTLGLAGVAAQKRMHDGSVHFGAFFDAGYSRYDTYNHVLEAAVPIRGKGDIENFGGGLAFRRNWDNGLRLDLMARAGVSRNRFESNDLVDVVTGAPSSFELHGVYAGASVGLDYGWKFRRSAFNVYGRYGWLMERGGETTLSSDEIVDFDALHSHRGTAGGRWTWDWNANLSPYVGAAYEYEFDGKVRLTDRTTGHNLVYDGMSLRGGTGVGEIGVTYRHSDRFDVTAGVEGYVGRRTGFSALVSAVWRW